MKPIQLTLFLTFLRIEKSPYVKYAYLMSWFSYHLIIAKNVKMTLSFDKSYRLARHMRSYVTSVFVRRCYIFTKENAIWKIVALCVTTAAALSKEF
jgi:hypothetical protein